MPKVAQQGIKPSSKLKPQLLTIKRHRLLQKGSPQFPAGLTSIIHTPYLGRPPPNLLPPRLGFQTSPTAQKSPRAVGQPLLPARSPAPPVERSARAPQPARAGSQPRPSPTQSEPYRRGERRRHRSQDPSAPTRPEVHSATPWPLPRAL